MQEITNINSLRPTSCGPVRIVPVCLVRSPRDYLAVAYASELASRLSALLDCDVMASKPVGPRIGEFACFDLGASFWGNVVSTADYLLVDDFVVQGSILADLRGFIESRGGNVLAVTTLRGGRGSEVLAAKHELVDELRLKHKALENWWRGRYQCGFDALTNVEAKCLSRFERADAIMAAVGPAESLVDSGMQLSAKPDALLNNFLDSGLHFDEWLVQRGLLKRWFLAWDAAHWDYKPLSPSEIETARADYHRAARELESKRKSREPTSR